MDEQRDWYTVEQVAARLQVNPETVYRWIRAGELGYLDLGRRAYRIRQADIDELERRRFKPAARPARTEE
jgi:excisionase family DNA binding protein